MPSPAARQEQDDGQRALSLAGAHQGLWLGNLMPARGQNTVMASHISYLMGC